MLKMYNFTLNPSTKIYYSRIFLYRSRRIDYWASKYHSSWVIQDILQRWTRL